MSFEAKAKLSLKLKGRPPSSTSFKKGEHVGEKNPQWHGGKWHTAQGYRLILQPGHLRANGRGYVMESILVAEECLGRALTKDETLHHINENRTDNSPENLYLFPSQADHKRYHMNVRHGKVPRIEKSNLK